MNFLSSIEEGTEVIDINITPLIDIVFLLLIFFMVSTTFVESQGVQVKLPQASSAATTDSKEDVIVSIKKDGSIFIDEKPVALSNLKSVFRKATQGGKEPTLIVRADQASQHGKVVSVMDAAHSEGIKRIAIATTPETQRKQ